MRGRRVYRAIGLLLLCLPLLATHAQASWQAVGQIGGPTQGVAVQERYAYAGAGLRLEVLDVSDPAAPRLVGVTRPFPHFVEDVAVSGALAYVAAGGAGLRVVDVSDPNRPAEVGFWSSLGYAEGVAVRGQTVYLADGPYGLRVLDVSNPARPVEVGSAYPMNYAFKVAVEGRFAYIAAAGAGLLVADVDDARAPAEVGSVATGGYAYGVAVGGGIAYVADGWEGLKTVSVADPAHPYQTGAFKTPGWALGVVVSGAVAYVADAFGGLRALDVSDPARPVEVVGAQIPAGHAGGLAMAGNMVYVADRNWGLRVFRRPSDSSLSQAGAHLPLSRADGVAVAGNYAYVASGVNGLSVVDVADPTRPMQSGAATLSGFSTCVVVRGKYAYVGSMLLTEPLASLYVIDVSDPTRPAVAGNTQIRNCTGMDVAGDIAYLAAETGLELVSVADPSHPISIGYLPMPQGGAAGVAVSGNRAYVAATSGGLQVIDVSDPRNPIRIGEYTAGSNAFWDVAVAGNTAYVADLFRLLVVDVSDPAHPVGMGSCPMPGETRGVAVSGNFAYVAAGGRGLSVVDVSDPYHPLPAGTFDSPGYSARVAVAGDRAYLADGETGLLILENSAGGQSVSASGEFASHVQLPGSTGQVFAERFPPAAAIPRRTTATAQFSPRPPASGSCLVTSPADGGAGTLRQCLQDAASDVSITFDPAVFPPDNPATIALFSALPNLNRGGITIDASDAGVVLDGSGTPPQTAGLVLVSDWNTVKGLQIIRFPGNGVEIRNGAKNNLVGGDRSRGTGPMGEGNVISLNRWGVFINGPGVEGNVLSGNFIGTDHRGTAAAGNRGSGIYVSAGPARNRIGGSTPGERNIISGNGNGINFQGLSSQNVVIGNFIGTDVSGTRALPNTNVGVNLMTGPSGTRIGGMDPGDRNVISGNGFGVNLQGSNTRGNLVLGNHIGTDASGRVAVGNLDNAVLLVGGTLDNTVRGNLLSGNGGGGVLISDWGSNYNLVSGNRIGTDVTGTAILPNRGFGVYVGYWGASFNRIGGTRPEDGNLISGNAMSGIAVGATENLVLGNLIGTDITGTRALGNASDGVGLGDGRTLVGGATTREANVISGNGGTGVNGTSGYNYVAGNYIGVDSGGQLRIGNLGCGVVTGERTVVQGNVIAYTATAPGKGPGTGVCPQSDSHVTLRRNSIHGNAGRGIEYPRGPGGVLLSPMLAAPVIGAVTATSVAGTACAGCEVEIFSDAEDEGRVFEGSVTANSSGVFALTKSSPLAGPNVTATATDRQGGTSEFSAPRAVPKPI